ncbi:MAG: hypothetical protein JNK67_27105 [Alphaproteobacteria bacterium]|nr:hypothetical protein [Alphaproteobacteria bacterium]
MARRAGIPLIDLVFLANRASALLPDDVQAFYERFVVTDHETRHAAGAIFHHGTLQPLDTALTEIPTGFRIGIGTLKLPLLQTGIPMQFGILRAPLTGTQNLEPAATAWRLDLMLDAFELVVDGLEPAIFVPDDGTMPRHLLRDPARENVRITGAAVLRFEDAGAGLTVKFVDRPDPLDPTLPSGAVMSLECTPPHFFIGGSEFGFTVGRILFDFSDDYSAPDVLARGQDAAWVGVAIREGTFYAPRNLPAFGDISGGVKNVLIGSPVGLQGELEIQFGRSPLDPASFQFRQLPAADLLPSASLDGVAHKVTITAAQGATVTIAAGLQVPSAPSDAATLNWKARWSWPDGTEDEGDASTGAVRHGQVLRVTPIEVVDVDGTPTDFPHPEVTFRFVASGTGPRIDAEIAGQEFTNVAHLGGIAADIERTVFTAVSSVGTPGTFEWRIEGRSETWTGPTFFATDLDTLAGDRMIVLSETIGDDDVRLTRLQLQIRESGALLVGCEAGVFDAVDASAALALAAVENTFDLSDFHAEGAFYATAAQATLSADKRGVVVPADGLARVTVADAVAPAPALDRHVQILMDFDTDNELRWGEAKPAGAPASGALSQSDLLAWAARYPGAQFLVIGRCDDIGDDVYNATLAADRATRATSLLTVLQPGQLGTPLAGAEVFARGEQASPSGGAPTGDGFDDETAIELVGRLIHVEQPGSTAWPDARFEDGVLSSHESVRETYRRVDIYAVGGTPTADTAIKDDEALTGAALRRSLVPAAGRDVVAAPSGSPKLDYMVKLRIVWDSPTVSELRDAIPTLAEAEFSWTPTSMPLPDAGGAPVPVTISDDPAKEVLTVFATWTHDTRTGYTKVALGIKSEGDPNGLAWTDNKTLTTALAVGPALMSGVTGTGALGAGARIAAMISLGVVGSVTDILQPGSKVALTSAAFETEMRSISDPGPDMQVRIVTDYVCTLHIDSGVLGLRTMPDSPLKIRYKRVGVEYDSSQTGWSRFGVVFDTASLEIEDPGRWEISGTLGNLLRIVEIAVGTGSLWIEARLAVAIEIGLIEITEAVIRLTFTDGSPIPVFELRGLVLSANVAGVLEGEGRVRIEDNGILRAGVDASIIPLGLGCEAALAVGLPPEIAPSAFLSLYLGVQFATPLPLAQSGLAIYGFKGLFTMNGTRAPVANPDPVLKELDWWNLRPEDKYVPQKDQFALGIGAVVGTLPDVSFSLSCAGMVVVAFPEPEVIFGVDVNIIKVPDLIAKDERGAESTITGLIVIDDEAIKLAVSATYTIPKVLTLNVPFAAYFPYPETPGDVYVRIGSDGQEQHGRYGEPVTLTLLPDVIDARAWAYLMIEQGGLPDLGGDTRFDFDGFSVGFGAGWEIAWKAGPIELDASAKVLVGFGTAPLIIKGGVFVAGKLDMVVTSISAHGELVLEARESAGDVQVKIEGEFCGEVDLLFFSLEGCVGISIAPDVDTEPPPPPSPVKGISLTDRRDRIMGVATKGTPSDAPIFSNPPQDPADAASQTATATAAGVDANNTVWPDTAPVIHFAHYVQNAMGSAAQFLPGPTPAQPKWFGSSELKYAYRLDSLVLRRASDDAEVESPAEDGALQSVWTATPYRQPDASGVDNPMPSEHEGPNLKLLDWDPWSWVVNLDDGGASQDGDPAETIEDICTPKPAPRTACVLGRSAMRAGHHAVEMRAERPGLPPYPSRFVVVGESAVRIGATRIVGRDLQALVDRLGCHVVPGVVTAMPFNTTIGGVEVSSAYRLPAARQVATTGLRDLALPWEARFDQRVARPSVTLLICEAPAQRPDEPAEAPCDDFAGLSPNPDPVLVLERPGMTIRTIDSRARILLADDVDLGVDPPRNGSDGRADLRIPDSGIEIVLRTPCAHVEIHVMQFTAAAVRGEALAPDGTRVDTDQTSLRQAVPLVLRFDAPAIRTLRLSGGGNEAAVFKICCHGAAQLPDRVCESFDALKPNDRAVTTLTYRDFVFTPLDGRGRLRAVDVVDERVAPLPGEDGAAEIRFPASGVRIALPHPCPVVEVHVMLFEAEPVDGIGRDEAGGDVAAARSTEAVRVTQVLRFASRTGAPVATIVLKGGKGQAVIHRICCIGAAVACVDFEGLKPTVDRVATLAHRGLRFETLSGARELRLVDKIDARPEPDRPGVDRIPELQFFSAGLRITLTAPCTRVDLKLMLFTTQPVSAVAINGAGSRVARAQTTGRQRELQTIRLDAPDIRVVELTGGGGESVLAAVCCREADGEGGRPPGAPGSLDDLSPPTSAGDVTVTGIVGDTPRDAWAVRVPETQAHEHCRLVVFQPARAATGPWDGFRVVAPPGKVVSLVAICGVDQRAIDARATDMTVQTQLRDSLVDVLAAQPDERREIALAANTEYEMVIGWSWKSWQPSGSQTTPPDPDLDSSPWQSGGTETWRFRTAADDTSLASAPQDGLNEYRFDARDIERYLIGIEPADGRGAHFTDDPIWVHFDCGHVEQLLEIYGRELVIEVRRTDPPPQATPELLTNATAPLEVEMAWLDPAAHLAATGDRRLNEAILTAPCLIPKAAPFGGASAAVTMALQPDAGYDLTILARKVGDRPVVRATRFRTSRYAGPDELIAALGYRVGGVAPYLPDDHVIPDGMTMASGTGLVEGDIALDDALMSIGADTLPLPLRKARSYAMWRRDGGSWKLEGLLVDSLEALKRERTIVAAGGQPNLGTRIAPLRGFAAGVELAPFRVNARWTRLLLKPAAAIALAATGDLELSLEFTTSAGPRVGRRRLRGVPAILEREGL